MLMFSTRTDDYRIALHRMYKMDSRHGVIALPGATQDQDWWFNLSLVTRELYDITQHRFPVLAGKMLDTWGNYETINHITDLWAAGLDRTGPFNKEDDLVHLLGVSAGGAAILNWHRQIVTTQNYFARSIALLIPVLDLEAVRSEDRGGFGAAITSAFGGEVPDHLNPAKFAILFRGVALRIYYSTNDPITTQQEYEDFIEVAEAEGINMGAVGHFWGPPWSGEHVAQFFEENDDW